MARARASADLARAGLYSCRFCHQTKPLQEGIVVTWGGNVMFALCPECYPGRPIVLEERKDSRGERAVYIGFLKSQDHPVDILPVRDISKVSDYVPKGTLAKYERRALDAK